jgi:hypothetical protein
MVSLKESKRIKIGITNAIMNEKLYTKIIDLKDKKKINDSNNDNDSDSNDDDDDNS